MSMSESDPAWTIVCVEDGSTVPVVDFIVGLKDQRRQANVVRKVQHLRDMTQAMGPDRVVRPLVESLRGSIKELRKLTDKQLRVLFSWERETKEILLLGGFRKKQDAVPEAIITEAERLHSVWLARKSGVPFEKALSRAGLEVGL
jgi:hypothetical protein